MSLINSLRWTLRKGFWNFIAMRKYRKATPPERDHYRADVIPGEPRSP